MHTSDLLPRRITPSFLVSRIESDEDGTSTSTSNAADVKLAWLGQSSFHIPPCLISFNPPTLPPSAKFVYIGKCEIMFAALAQKTGRGWMVMYNAIKLEETIHTGKTIT